MGQLTVYNLPDEIIRRLKIRAAEHGHSAEAEHREILKQALIGDQRPQIGREEFWRRADELRKRLGPMPDSTPLIRKMRDER